MDGAQNFRIKKINDKQLWRYKIASTCKTRNLLASKLRPVKTLKGEKMLLYSREGNSTIAERHGWSFL